MSGPGKTLLVVLIVGMPIAACGGGARGGVAASPETPAPPAIVTSVAERQDAAPPAGRELDLGEPDDEHRGSPDTADGGTAGTTPSTGSQLPPPLGATRAAIRSCKTTDGPTGPGRVVLLFLPDGTVADARFLLGPYAGTAVGDCILTHYRGVRFPPLPTTVRYETTFWLF